MFDGLQVQGKGTAAYRVGRIENRGAPVGRREAELVIVGQHLIDGNPVEAGEPLQPGHRDGSLTAFVGPKTDALNS
jgi:hypothetical protein